MKTFLLVICIIFLGCETAEEKDASRKMTLRNYEREIMTGSISSEDLEVSRKLRAIINDLNPKNSSWEDIRRAEKEDVSEQRAKRRAEEREEKDRKRTEIMKHLES